VGRCLAPPLIFCANGTPKLFIIFLPQAREINMKFINNKHQKREKKNLLSLFIYKFFEVLTY